MTRRTSVEVEAGISGLVTIPVVGRSAFSTPKKGTHDNCRAGRIQTMRFMQRTEFLGNHFSVHMPRLWDREASSSVFLFKGLRKTFFGKEKTYLGHPC